MANNSVGELRRSAVVMTYAPGSIVDMRAGSAPVSGVGAGLEEWDRSAPLSGNLRNQKIVERRLCKKLGKKYFRLPPVLEDGATRLDGSPDTSSLVLRRFPTWLQCPECDELRLASKWKADPGQAYRYCSGCSAKQVGGKKIFVIPVRFAAACVMGHLDEFPWNFWVGHRNDCASKGKGVLKLESFSPGLGGLILSCPTCKARRSMDGVFGEKALTGLICHGSRPWLHSNDPHCTCSGEVGTFRAVQRGASNLYYPIMESALDIPPWTRHLERTLSDYWDILADIDGHDGRVAYIESSHHLRRVLERENITASSLAKNFERMVNDADALDVSNLKIEEYRVFTSPIDEIHDQFEIHREVVPAELTNFISSLVRVSRLREVRAVRGFTRINAPTDPDAVHVAPISESSLDWLPAIEVRGEGVFIELNGMALSEWENGGAVKARAKSVSDSWEAEWRARNPLKDRPFDVTPRLLMIHTLSHALIRQLTLECGYSTASLRERVYVCDGETRMAGVLIYTATSDADGTLGGLQRRANGELFVHTLIGALKSARWCSADPLCIHGETGAPDSHSIGACHSCSLVPETSCEYHNRFLDRALLTGYDDEVDFGYFESLSF